MNENTITVLEIDPVIRHRAASERLCQSRYSGAVSDPGLVIDVHQAVGAGEDGHGPALFAVDVGAAQMGNGLDTVDGLPFRILLDEAGVTLFLEVPRDAIDGEIPILFLPLVAVGRAVQYLFQAAVVGFRGLVDARSLRAQRAFIDGMFGVAFDIDDLAGLRIGAAQKPTPHRTVAADGGGLFGGFDPVVFGQFLSKGFDGKHTHAKAGEQDSRAQPA